MKRKLTLTAIFLMASSLAFASTTSQYTEPKKYNTIPEMVVLQAERHNLPPKFALAIVRLESNFQPKVRGLAGEYGLGQIKCPTARMVGFKGDCSKLLIPEINLEYSMRYLKHGYKATGGDLCRTAMFYNSGQVYKPSRAPSEYCIKMRQFHKQFS